MLLRKFTPMIQQGEKLYLSPWTSFRTTSICNIIKMGKKESSEGDTKSIAVVLCGCGSLDGTEVTEAVSVAIHCSQKGFKTEFYAPEKDLCEVINHCTGEAVDEKRNALIEAARISRSSIKPLSECKPHNVEGIIFPGGLGAIKTLSNFASDGCDCIILPEVQKIIEDFCCCKKPIGAICISPILIAKVLEGVKITLGNEGPPEKWPFGAAIQKAKKMGAKVEKKNVNGVTFCKKYNVYSTPACMYGPATPCEIFSGIGKMISKMIKSMK